MRDKGAGLFHKIAQVAPDWSSINPSRPSDARDLSNQTNPTILLIVPLETNFKHISMQIK